jgi:hypothetical protein
MLSTPARFVPLLVPVAAPELHAFVFRGNELLIRAADLALPDAAFTAALGAAAAQTLPIGLLNDHSTLLWGAAAVQRVAQPSGAPGHGAGRGTARHAPRLPPCVRGRRPARRALRVPDNFLKDRPVARAS